MSMTQNTTAVRAKPVATQGPSAAQRLEAAKDRYQKLLDRATRVKIELQAASNQLAEARTEAEVDFGTGDLEGLRARYAEIERENEQRVGEFLQALDSQEQSLSEVEAQLGG